MKNIFKSFWSWVKAHKIWSIIILIIVVLIGWYSFKNSSENAKYVEIPVVRGSLSEIVSVTGNVKPLADVDLAFEMSGRVANINVAVGDKVYAGEELATISNADLSANLNQARANLKKAQAGLGDNADQATLNFSQAKDLLVNAINDSYTKADDALRNKIYSLFTDPNRYRARLAFSTDTFLQEDIENGKDDVSDLLDTWYKNLSKSNDASNLEANYAVAKANLEQIKNLLNKCAEAVNGLTPENSYITQTQIDAWKLNISTARTNINSAIDTLVSSFNQYKTASLAVKISVNSTVAEQASVEQAQAGVESAQAALAKSIIRSPINGIITNIVPKLGEIVSLNQSVISIISYGDYEVESFVPEADIAKVKIGNLASTTLDAYGSNVNFETAVIKIDPAATVIDGVPTYKVTLKFSAQDDRIRSGMTANLDILTKQKDNVLILPSRVIKTKDDDKYVTVLNPLDKSELLDKKIITGLRGLDGNVEIISGLLEGEKVVSQ